MQLDGNVGEVSVPLAGGPSRSRDFWPRRPRGNRDTDASEKTRGEKSMDFDEYQRLTEVTDVRPDPQDVGFPLLGLAGEVGSLVAEYKKRLRAGASYEGFEDEVREELGDLLWYAATLARTLDLSLDDIATANLEKTALAWGDELPPPPAYDAEFPPEQRLPRQFTVRFVAHERGGVAHVA